jgi:cobaltochelatase CobS
MSDEFFEHGKMKVKRFPIDEKTKFLIPKKRFFIVENEFIEQILWAIEEQRSGGEPCNFLLVGEPGTGKSELVMYLASELNIPLMQIQGDGEQSVADLVGCSGFDEDRGGTVWYDGKLPFGCRHKCSFLFDEINGILPDVLMKTHSMLDDRRALDLKEHIVVQEQDGQRLEIPEMVQVPQETIVFGTMNPHDTGRHVGTKPLSPALESRFQIRINVGYLSQSNEIKMLMHRTKIDKGTAEKIVEVANESRKAFRNQEMSIPLDHRMTISWARFATKFGIANSIQTTILSRLDEADYDALRGLLISYGIEKAIGRK